MTSEFKAALDAGARVTFTCSGAGCTVTIACGEGTFTGHAQDAVAALGRALAALPAR